MDRRAFLRHTVGSVALGSVIDAGCSRRSESSAPHTESAGVPAFELDEATIDDLQQWMASRRYTARSLTELYLKRIDETNRQGPKLGAVIETNPDALRIADELDAERRASGPRGPLHGIPLLMKDNVDTADRMLTTAGSPALAGSKPARDAFIVARLRRAGAIVIGKTNLIEFAGFKGTPQFSWSTRGGHCRNPYALDRSALGSSCGSAVAASANLAAAAIGTETHGSILAPSAFTGVVGIKPTVGLVSRAGIVPVAASFDTAGPIARTVRDAAIVLAALAGSDPDDPATSANHAFDYEHAVAAGGLSGARIGIARGFFGEDRRVVQILDSAVDRIKQNGGVPVMLSDDQLTPKRLDPIFPSWLVVMTTEFKAGLNRYLQTRGPDAPVKSLKDVIEFNIRAGDPLRVVDQQLLLSSEAAGPLTGDEYRKAAAVVRAATRDEGLDPVFRTNRLDCVIAPTLLIPASVSDPIDGDSLPPTEPLLGYAAMAGYPSLTMPVGAILGLPVGLCLVGLPWRDAELVRIAYAIEQATKARTPPRFLETVTLGV